MQGTEATTGLQLKLLRISLGLTAKAVAAAAGVERQRIGTIEGSRRPTERAIAKYLDALSRCAQR